MKKIEKLTPEQEAKMAECEKLEEKWSIGFQKFCDKDNKLQHYKQALDEIEELASKWYENSIIKYYADYEEILNIISKAKDVKWIQKNVRNI